MRIISGVHKGRKFMPPKNLPTRPTTDFTKESLFNILDNQFYFDEISVLDLFSGTGSISYEFASRGTQKITAVDQHSGCIRFIDQTAQALEMPIQSIKSEALTYLKNASSKYDIIFADPPYDMDIQDFTQIVTLVFDNQLLEEEGILVIEHNKHIDLSQVEHHYSDRKYGDSVLSFYR